MAENESTGQIATLKFWASTSWTESSIGVLDTAGTLPIYIVPIETEQDMEELLSKEQIRIKIADANAVDGFYILARNCSFVALPNNEYILTRASLKYLEKAGISFNQMELA